MVLAPDSPAGDAAPQVDVDVDLDVALRLLPSARLLSDPADVLEARRLQAREYVRVGYVAQGDLAADGTLEDSADPWVAWSWYFGSFDATGRLRATCRAISGLAPRTLPTLRLPTFDASVRERLAGLPRGAVAEVSALAREPGVGPEHVRAVFRALWRDALERNVRAWVASMDELVLASVRTMDHEAFRVVGGPCPAPVRPVMPVWLDIAEVEERMFVNGLAIREVILP